MAILRNYCNESAIKLEMNLRADKGLIYDRNKKDYLNWIPYILEVTVENDNFILSDMSLSVEGLKCFLGKIKYILDEPKLTSDYKRVDYCGAENEFEIVFQNIDDYYADTIIQVELWINAAYIPQRKPQYSLGYRFIIKTEELVNFNENLKIQLQEIIENPKSI